MKRLLNQWVKLTPNQQTAILFAQTLEYRTALIRVCLNIPEDKAKKLALLSYKFNGSHFSEPLVASNV